MAPVAQRSIADIERELAATQSELNATGPVLLERRVVALQDELIAARTRSAAEDVVTKTRETAQRLENFRAVLATLKTERSQAEIHASRRRTVDAVEKAFELDAQVVACAGDLATVLEERPESLLGVSTVKDSLAEMRRDPVLRRFFYRNPTEPRPPVDRSRWAHLLPAA